MLINGEQKILYTLAKDYFKNEGLIFDAGLYLGASTMCFAKGLQHNKKLDLNNLNRKPIQSFERGICGAHESKTLNASYPELLLTKAGDNFLPLLGRNIKDISDLVDLYEGDIIANLNQMNLSEAGYQYEIVFLDVLKNASINDCIVKNVFPRLIPGRTILIQQDFVHECLPFINVTMGYLRDYFELICFCGASAVFLNTKQIPQEMLNHKFYQDFTPEQMLQLFDLGTDYNFDNWQSHLISMAKYVLIPQKFSKQESFDFIQARKEKYEKDERLKPFINNLNTNINWIKKYV